MAGSCALCVTCDADVGPTRCRRPSALSGGAGPHPHPCRRGRALGRSFSARPRPPRPSFRMRPNAAEAAQATRRQLPSPTKANAETLELLGESLVLLDWPIISAQVAAFTQTAGGYRATAKGLRLARTVDECDQLYEETQEAAGMSPPLDLTAIADLRPLVERLRVASTAAEADSATGEGEGDGATPVVVGLNAAAAAARVALVTDLLALGTTLTAARVLWARIQDAGPAASALAKRAAGNAASQAFAFPPHLTTLEAAITVTLVAPGGDVADTASPAVADARTLKRAVSARLRSVLAEAGARLVAAGASDRAAISLRRNRLCIPGRAAAARAVLGPGCVVLGASASGTTIYCEPAEAIDLNNAALAAGAAESAAEAAALRSLAAAAAACAPALRSLAGALTCLDAAAARAAHAKWLISIGSGRVATVRPRITAGCGEFIITGLLSPILLAQAKGPLPEPRHKMRAAPRNDQDPPLSPSPPPVGVDVLVRSGVRAVVITGPNTGGKTAALKAFGLAALMSRAGIYVPAAHPAVLPLFDAVLADIGDAQSLTSGLSTFSGHIARARAVLQSSRPATLVLLDEVGAGTDPAQGAALGAALLRRLAASSTGPRLTIASTHHGALKALKYGDDTPGVFDNACVEFDGEALRPTYRLLWGLPGMSHGLAIAARLQLPTSVIAAATARLGKAAATENSAIGELEAARRATETSAKEANRLRAAAAADDAAAKRIVDDDASSATAAAAVAVRALRAAMTSARTAVRTAGRSRRSMLASGGDIDMRRAGRDDGGARDVAPVATLPVRDEAPDPRPPTVGDQVKLSRLGGKLGVVTAVTGKKISVRVGAVVMNVPRADVARI